MATATAIGPTGPRVHQPRGGGARLTRTLVIVAGVAIATAMFVMIVALHSDSPDSSQAVRSDNTATVTSNEERAAIAELEAKARSQKPPDVKSVPLPPPSPTLTTHAPAVPPPARPPSRLAELRDDEYVKALSAPTMGSDSSRFEDPRLVPDERSLWTAARSDRMEAAGLPELVEHGHPGHAGADQAGYAGFSDEVNNHYLKTFGTAALISVISAGQTVGQLGAFGGGTGFSGPYGYGYATPNQMSLLSEMGGAAASQQLGQVAQSSLQRGMNIPPTLEIRPGYQFNVMVTNDLILPGPYRN